MLDDGPTLNLDFNEAGSLPVPSPLPDAVEAGLFGGLIGDVSNPSFEEIAGIVREHLYDLVDLTLRIQGYEAAQRSGCHPQTGRPARTERGRQANRRRASGLWREATCLRLAQYDLYDRAFGVAARRRFQAVVEKLAASAGGDPPPVQQDLF